jgi:DUF971 family protein
MEPKDRNKPSAEAAHEPKKVAVSRNQKVLVITADSGEKVEVPLSSIYRVAVAPGAVSFLYRVNG